MMYKIAIWGTGKTSRKCEEVLDSNRCCVVMYIETAVKKDLYKNLPVYSIEEVHPSDIDYIIIASVFEEEIQSLLTQYGGLQEKALYWNRTDDKIKILDMLGKPFSQISPAYCYYMSKKAMPYQVCEADEALYMFNTCDDCISKCMIDSQETFSKQEIDFFFRHVKKNNGYFFDIGANIGTTSVYIKKNIDPELEVIAFEPLKENYNMFRINMILNNCEDITLERLALSDSCEKLNIKAERSNMGGSHIVSQIDTDTELIEGITLDEYINRKGYLADRIGYLWIDVEGHEANVIKGAERTLRITKAPLFMEFNPEHYKYNGLYNDLIDILKSTYSKFICAEQAAQGKEQWRDVQEIELVYEELQHKQCNILFKKNESEDLS